MLSVPTRAWKCPACVHSPAQLFAFYRNKHADLTVKSLKLPFVRCIKSAGVLKVLGLLHLYVLQAHCMGLLF